ncbi:MAG: hypothetical protein DRJ56_02130 [Thermoprotei archaeon]|nr:MAG: hypothetical protein DRJ56_02130 [Thermoprotei archaeon]
MRGEVRYAVVGAGRRGLRHLRILSEIEGARPVAVCDVDEAKVRAASERFGVRPYTSLDDMLAKERLDVAVICSPVECHVPQALKCLEAGVSAILEKPVSLSARELRKLLEACRKTDLVVAVGFQLRYSALVDEVRRVVSGERLSMLVGWWYWTVPLVPWIRRRDLAGGQVVEQAVHLVDLFRYLAGDVEEVAAFYTERGRDTEEDREVGFDNWASYAVTLRFRSGVVGSLATTYALFPGLFKEGGGHPVGVDAVCREVLVRYAPDVEVAIYRRGAEPQVIRDGEDATKRMHRVMLEALLTGDSSLIRTPYEDSYKTMLTVLAANESARLGRMVRVKELELAA